MSVRRLGCRDICTCQPLAAETISAEPQQLTQRCQACMSPSVTGLVPHASALYHWSKAVIEGRATSFIHACCHPNPRRNQCCIRQSVAEDLLSKSFQLEQPVVAKLSSDLNTNLNTDPLATVTHFIIRNLTSVTIIPLADPPSRISTKHLRQPEKSRTTHHSSHASS